VHSFEDYHISSSEENPEEKVYFSVF